MSDKIYGLAIVDIHVPDHLKENFEELPPNFKNTIVNRTILDGHMKQLAVTIKMAVKGSNRNISNSLENYKSVLETKKTYENINRGFTLADNQIKK